MKAISTLEQAVQPFNVMGKDYVVFDEFPSGPRAVVRMFRNYHFSTISIAATGHEATASSQSQPPHLSGPITQDLSSLIAKTSGHSSAQTPQPMHNS
jgi:hypothetical protein